MNSTVKKIITLFRPVLIAAALLVILGIVFSINSSDKTIDNKEYIVEINRLQNSINNSNYTGKEDFKYITNIEKLNDNASKEEHQQFYDVSGNNYCIIMCNDGLYRVTYETHTSNIQGISYGMAFIGLVFILILMVLCYLYIYFKILRPFNQISELPLELSRGDMTGRIPESKNHFFGRFIWGLNMLSDSLRDEKQKELKLEKEKKTMILSISHDLKTPLSAVKLYAKAMEQGMYDSPDKIKETAVSIGLKTEEIQNKINEIAEASSEEFINFEVECNEFYLLQLLEQIRTGYTDRLRITQTEFSIDNNDNCLLYGDYDRSFEVVQNIIENAIKYGDGRYIRISVSYEEDCCLISIDNSGNSIVKEETLHIFDCFYRGSNVKDKQGNGLGLYICRKLMHLMKGDIYAETDEDFRVTLVFRKI